MARNTRLATTITARYTPSVGAVDAFYLDGRISGQREEQFADITLDREDRGSFFAVYASSHGNRGDAHQNDGNRQYLDQITNDLKKNNRRNIDYEINELAECVVNVSGRLTLADAAIRQPYFSGIIVKDGEMAAITLGRGCAYLYRDDTLYPLTQDEFQLEAIDGRGHRVSNMGDFSAGIAGTIRYSNIAQLKQDDCIILCNKEVMEAVGQRQMLQMLDLAEDQCDAAGMVMDVAASENPHISMQFMIGFVEDIVTVDRLGRGTLARGFTSRTTGRGGQKNNAALFSDFDEGYKKTGQTPQTPVPTPPEQDSFGGDRDYGEPEPPRPDFDSDEPFAAEEATYDKSPQGDSQLYAASHTDGFDASTDSTDDSDSSLETAYGDRAEGMSDYQSNDYQTDDYAADDPDQDAPQIPVYTPGAGEQFMRNDPDPYDDDYNDDDTSYADYGANDNVKKIAVVALAVVAVVLLIFIINSLIGSPDGTTDTSGTTDELPGIITTETTDGETETTGTESADTGTETTATETEAVTDPTDDGTTATTTTEETASPTPEPTTTTASPTPEPTTTAAPTTTETPATTTVAPTTAEPTPVPTANTYTVAPGDSLFSIAMALYNDPNYVDLIAAANGLDPETDVIQVGDELILPD